VSDSPVSRTKDCLPQGFAFRTIRVVSRLHHFSSNFVACSVDSSSRGTPTVCTNQSHSAATCAPLATTERFIKKRRTISANATTAKIKKVSK
jgi:hypothetical protein